MLVRRRMRSTFEGSVAVNASRRGVRVAVALVAGASLLAGCSKAGTERAERGAGSAPPAATTQTPGSPSPAASAISEAHFDVVLKPAGAYKAGEPGKVELVLQAKAPYHSNPEYPYKLTLEESPGVSYPSKVVARDAVKLEHMQATMTIPFTPTSAGKKKIAGRYSFSVCSEDKCVIEKRDVTLEVEVM